MVRNHCLYGFFTSAEKFVNMSRARNLHSQSSARFVAACEARRWTLLSNYAASVALLLKNLPCSPAILERGLKLNLRYFEIRDEGLHRPSCPIVILVGGVDLHLSIGHLVVEVVQFVRLPLCRWCRS